jgi:hypothetical protein
MTNPLAWLRTVLGDAEVSDFCARMAGIIALSAKGGRVFATSIYLEQHLGRGVAPSVRRSRSRLASLGYLVPDGQVGSLPAWRLAIKGEAIGGGSVAIAPAPAPEDRPTKPKPSKAEKKPTDPGKYDWHAPDPDIIGHGLIRPEAHGEAMQWPIMRIVRVFSGRLDGPGDLETEWQNVCDQMGGVAYFWNALNRASAKKRNLYPSEFLRIIGEIESEEAQMYKTWGG